MCGICGVVPARGIMLGVSQAGFDRMRDRLAHRGPDDAGTLWIDNDNAGHSVALGHRRLAIIDPTDAGHQPMTTPDGRYTIVYNGELYNDPELRSTLADEGVRFRSSSDTETLLHAVSRWGTDACEHLRGMYAFALWDHERHRLTLARDGLGIKPLYWTRVGQRIIFASEIPAILIHPDIRAVPDWVTVSSYVSTVRTTLDDRTLYENIRAVRPGEWITIDCSNDALSIEHAAPPQPSVASDADAPLRDVIHDSLKAHLRSDVPWCSLLSGGIDSTIIASLAIAEAGSLRTYVSGCPDAADGLADDFDFAREAASAIGSSHTEVPVDEHHFIQRWPEMTAALGVPLSTPNEIAINAVANRLQQDGHKVALSGEGADELFAGYELPMTSAAEWVAGNLGATHAQDARAALDSAAWMPLGNKHIFLSPDLLSRSVADAMLQAWYTTVIHQEHDVATRHDAPPDEARVRSFLGLQRRINLVGLLQRLDTATMLASVEGRVPFSDALVLAASRRIRLADLFTAQSGSSPNAQTKLALRNAFADRVPASIAQRSKRSFPLPFHAWLPRMTAAIDRSEFLREVYTPEAVAFACTDPSTHWNLAWPMFNLALWAGAAFEGGISQPHRTTSLPSSQISG